MGWATQARCCLPPMASGSSVLSRITSGRKVHPAAPRVSAELPGSGERFRGFAAASWFPRRPFAIRKPASRGIHPRGLCLRQAFLTADVARHLRERGSPSRANILVAGGTSTGKTTLTNALLAEVAKNPRTRVILDRGHARAAMPGPPNLVALRTKDGARDLVRSRPRVPLRLRPDRIPIGEVRGPEAPSTLLKAWGTGHPGGIGTIHARVRHWCFAAASNSWSRKRWSRVPRARDRRNHRLDRRFCPDGAPSVASTELAACHRPDRLGRLRPQRPPRPFPTNTRKAIQ